MKYSYDQISNEEILDQIKIGTLAKVPLKSTEFKKQIRIDQLKFQLQQIFSTLTESDLEASELNSNGVSTISSITYSTYSLPIQNRKVVCTLTQNTEETLLEEVLDIYQKSVKLQVADFPTDPIQITQHLQQYQVFWDDFRRKLNQTCQIFHDYLYVKKQFKEIFQNIIQPKLNFLNILILQSIQAKVLQAPDPTFLAIRKCYEIIQACGQDSQNILTNYLINGFQDIVLKSFQCFEKSENSFEKGVQSVMREISIISQIVCYLNYDQGREYFQFQHNKQFQAIMLKLQKNIISNSYSLKVCVKLISCVKQIIFIDKNNFQNFQTQWTQLDKDQKYQLIKNLSDIAQVCTFYNEFSETEDTNDTLIQLQSIICQCFTNDLKLIEVKMIENSTTQLLLGEISSFSQYQSINNKVEDNFIYLIIEMFKFYKNLVSQLPNKESLNNDLKFSLQNFFINIKFNHKDQEFQQNLILLAINNIMIVKNMYQLLINKLQYKKTFKQVRFQSNLAVYHILEDQLNILLEIVSCTFNGNYNFILSKLCKDSLLRIYHFNTSSILEETKLLNMLSQTFFSQDIVEYYQQNLESFFKQINASSSPIIDQELLQIMGYHIQTETKKWFETDAPEIVFGILDNILIVCEKDQEIPAIGEIDCFYAIKQEEIESHIDSNVEVQVTKDFIHREEKITQAIIVRLVKINGPMSIQEISQQIQTDEQEVKDIIQTLVEQDIIQINDQMKIAFDE